MANARLLYPALALVAAWLAQPVAASCGGLEPLLPFVPGAGWPNGWQGFVRIDNAQEHAQTVRFVATDDLGNTYDQSVQVSAGQTVHLNSEDLSYGNPAKGIDGVNALPEGSWRLCFKGLVGGAVTAYVRTRDGFLTDATMTVEASTICKDECPEWKIPVFNPARNTNQVSSLRLINNSDDPVPISIAGFREDGEQNATADGAPMTVQGFIPVGEAVEITSQQLESGTDIPLLLCDPEDSRLCLDTVGALGPASGKWSLYVNLLDSTLTSNDLVVMNLLRTPTGHITTLPASGSDSWLRR